MQSEHQEQEAHLSPDTRTFDDVNFVDSEEFIPSARVTKAIASPPAEELFVGKSNMVANFSPPKKAQGYEAIINFLKKHKIHYAITCTDFFIFPKLLKEFWYSAHIQIDNHGSKSIAGSIGDGYAVIRITRRRFRAALRLNGANFEAPASDEEFKEVLDVIGYQGNKQGKIVKSKLVGIWNYLFAIIIECLGNKTGSFDQPNHNEKIFAEAVITGRNIDFAGIIFDDLIAKVEDKQREARIPYPRFISMAIARVMKDLYPTEGSAAEFARVGNVFMKTVENTHPPMTPYMLQVLSSNPEEAGADSPDADAPTHRAPATVEPAARPSTSTILSSPPEVQTTREPSPIPAVQTSAPSGTTTQTTRPHTAPSFVQTFPTPPRRQRTRQIARKGKGKPASPDPSSHSEAGAAQDHSVSSQHDTVEQRGHSTGHTSAHESTQVGPQSTSRAESARPHDETAPDQTVSEGPHSVSRDTTTPVVEDPLLLVLLARYGSQAQRKTTGSPHEASENIGINPHDDATTISSDDDEPKSALPRQTPPPNSNSSPEMDRGDIHSPASKSVPVTEEVQQPSQRTGDIPAQNIHSTGANQKAGETRRGESGTNVSSGAASFDSLQAQVQKLMQELKRIDESILLLTGEHEALDAINALTQEQKSLVADLETLSMEVTTKTSLLPTKAELEILVEDLKRRISSAARKSRKALAETAGISRSIKYMEDQALKAQADLYKRHIEIAKAVHSVNRRLDELEQEVKSQGALLQQTASKADLVPINALLQEILSKVSQSSSTTAKATKELVTPSPNDDNKGEKSAQSPRQTAATQGEDAPIIEDITGRESDETTTEAPSSKAQPLPKVSVTPAGVTDQAMGLQAEGEEEDDMPLSARKRKADKTTAEPTAKRPAITEQHLKQALEDTATIIKGKAKTTEEVSQAESDEETKTAREMRISKEALRHLRAEEAAARKQIAIDQEVKQTAAVTKKTIEQMAREETAKVSTKISHLELQRQIHEKYNQQLEVAEKQKQRDTARLKKMVERRRHPGAITGVRIFTRDKALQLTIFRNNSEAIYETIFHTQVYLLNIAELHELIKVVEKSGSKKKAEVVKEIQKRFDLIEKLKESTQADIEVPTQAGVRKIIPPTKPFPYTKPEIEKMIAKGMFPNNEGLNVSIPLGVTFEDCKVLVAPEHGLLYKDGFENQCFQRTSELPKANTKHLLGLKWICIINPRAAPYTQYVNAELKKRDQEPAEPALLEVKQEMYWEDLSRGL